MTNSNQRCSVMPENICPLSPTLVVTRPPMSMKEDTRPRGKANAVLQTGAQSHPNCTQLQAVASLIMTPHQLCAQSSISKCHPLASSIFLSHQVLFCSLESVYASCTQEVNKTSFLSYTTDFGYITESIICTCSFCCLLAKLSSLFNL